MTILHQNFEDYSEEEFLLFITDICCSHSGSEQEQDEWVGHFEKKRSIQMEVI